MADETEPVAPKPKPRTRKPKKPPIVINTTPGAPEHPLEALRISEAEARKGSEETPLATERLDDWFGREPGYDPRRSVSTLVLIALIFFAAGGLLTYWLYPKVETHTRVLTRTPPSCLSALHKSDQVLEISTNTIQLVSDGLDALSKQDVAALDAIIASFGDVAGQVGDLAGGYVTASSNCRRPPPT